MIVKEEMKQRILDLLPSSADTSITLNELTQLTGYSAREVKIVISDLRNTYPICARETNGGGYWIAQTEHEIVEFVQMINRRRTGYTRTIHLMKHYLSDKTYHKLENEGI